MTSWLNKKLTDAGFSLERAPTNEPSMGQIIREWCLIYEREVNRWRPVSEPPASGQRILVAHASHGWIKQIAYIRDDRQYALATHWKPFGFPEVSDE